MERGSSKTLHLLSDERSNFWCRFIAFSFREFTHFWFQPGIIIVYHARNNRKSVYLILCGCSGSEALSTPTIESQASFLFGKLSAASTATKSVSDAIQEASEVGEQKGDFMTVFENRVWAVKFWKQFTTISGRVHKSQLE